MGASVSGLRHVVVACAVGAAVLTGCSLVVSLDGLTGETGAGLAGKDAAGDTSDVGESGKDAAGDNTSDVGEAIVYHDMTSRSLWSFFDTTSAFAPARDFAGAAFDGRYVYLAPSNGGVIVRYDTEVDFTVATSWSTFDATQMSGSVGFAGAVFDGRYVYFVPFGGGYNGSLARYDTHASFSATSSWLIFDATSIDPGAEGFVGAVFDGRYIYFAPNRTQSALYEGLVARYDTQAGLTDKSSWATFDTLPAGPTWGACDFKGAVFDGRYVYLVPNLLDGNGGHGLLARYDTQGSGFNASTSWSFFDTTQVNPSALAFFGGAFDGQYLYLAPSDPSGAPAIVTRYDTRGDFNSAWSGFDTTSVKAGPSFAGGAFDGRYVYLLPNNESPNALVARYDTEATFNSAASWSTFDLTSANAGAKGFIGAAFDGRYLYLVPSSGGVVARFDARAPRSMPTLPAFHGSFL
jgi:hypothetical protein